MPASSTFLRRTPIAVALLLGAVALPAAAADINSVQLLNQSDFRLLSEDLGAAVSYKPLTPAEPLGITGFDIGVAVTGTKIKNESVLRTATGGDSWSTIPVPTLRVYKGLPFDIDVGLAYANIPNSNLKYVGGEIRYAILAGNVALPAVAVRLSHTQLSGVDQLGLRTTGIDLSVSKGFAFATPYAGIGQVWIKSSPKGVPTLVGESFQKGKVFGGVNFNFGLVNLALEADSTGGTASYGAKFGLRF